MQWTITWKTKEKQGFFRTPRSSGSSRRDGHTSISTMGDSKAHAGVARGGSAIFKNSITFHVNRESWKSSVIQHLLSNCSNPIVSRNMDIIL